MSIRIQALCCGPYEENAFVAHMDGRDDCVVVDPGGNLALLERAVGEKRVAAILLTHGHFDHILAAQPLSEKTGAPVYIHEADMEMLNDGTLNAYDPFAADLPQPNALRALALGDSLSAAGMDFEVLHTPGHSKGSVCLYLPAEGVLFSGDTLFMAGYGRMDLHGGSPRRMRESLLRLFGLPGEVRVCPGHGAETTIGKERSRYRL